MSTFPKSGQFDSDGNRDEAGDFESNDQLTDEYAAESAATNPHIGYAQEATSDSDELLEDVANSGTLSVVGSTLVFKGDLVSDEDLLIQGRIQGTIEHNADNLTIGVHGKVKADIRARNILVQGEVHGNMYATERVIVESSARVVGDIFSPTVGLKEGAKFKGSIDMDGTPEEISRPEPEVAAKKTQETASRRTPKRRGPKTSPTARSSDSAVSDAVVDATLSKDKSPSETS